MTYSSKLIKKIGTEYFLIKGKDKSVVKNIVDTQGFSIGISIRAEKVFNS